MKMKVVSFALGLIKTRVIQVVIPVHLQVVSQPELSATLLHLLLVYRNNQVVNRSCLISQSSVL